MEKITPNNMDEKNPILSVFTERLLPRNRLSLNTPRKFRPKIITIKPENNVDRCLIFAKKAAHSSCQCAEYDEHDCKAGYKAKYALQSFFGCSFTALRQSMKYRLEALEEGHGEMKVMIPPGMRSHIAFTVTLLSKHTLKSASQPDPNKLFEYTELEVMVQIPVEQPANV